MQSSFCIMKLQDYCIPANIPSSSASLRLRPTITPSLLMSIVLGLLICRTSRMGCMVLCVDRGYATMATHLLR